VTAPGVARVLAQPQSAHPSPQAPTMLAANAYTGLTPSVRHPGDFQPPKRISAPTISRASVWMG
jgi:hypothetical protein